MKTGNALKLLLCVTLCLCGETRSEERVETAEAVQRGVDLLLEMQEGEGGREWPYEGVYRVPPRREIPIGYRVGGTAICAMAVTQTPGYAGSETRRAAVRRALEFICDSVDHPLMAHEFESRYDVRGWGYAYGLTCLLRLKGLGHVPDDLAEPVERAIRFYLDGIERTAIPETGGWNYARRGGFHAPGPPAPFMTAPTLQALFEAKRQGYEVDGAIVEAGLASLAKARTPTGGFSYSGTNGSESRAAVPGATGRMAVAEATLFLAGRSDLARVRAALDAFIAHWEWLEKRRAQNGTHEAPYGIAPYYFYYAHYYAAQAVELLPERERAEYRRRVEELLFRTRSDEGTWNDRVFPRSANFGTAMSVMALTMADAPPLSFWTSEDGEKSGAGETGLEVQP